MRFDRYPRNTVEEVSPQRLRAAQRFVDDEKEKFALFPDMAEDKDAMVRAKRILVARRESWQENRIRHAALWRKVRRWLSTLPDGPQRAVRMYWQNGPLPASPEYLADLIHQAEKGKCFWHHMAALRRFKLISQGRLPNPWKKSA